MKKTLLALACAAMATASIQAESVDMVSNATDWKNFTTTYASFLMTHDLIGGTAYNAGFRATWNGCTDVPNNAFCLWNNTGTNKRYMILTGNANDYLIESIEITFGPTAYDTTLDVRASDTPFTTSSSTAGESMMEIPYVAGETFTVDINNKFFSIVNNISYTDNGNVMTKPQITNIKINYAAGAAKDDPSWTLVNPGNDMSVGDILTPSVENNTENLDITYTLKFGTLAIKANADGTFTIPYSNGTYYLTATSASTDSFNAKDETVSFTVAAQTPKWVLEAPADLVPGDSFAPYFSTIPETDLDVTITLFLGKVTEKEDEEGNITTSTSYTTEIARNADGTFTVKEAGPYKLTAENAADSKYSKKTQTVYFTVSPLTGVETIDLTAPATYYTLQGLAVKDLTPGLYIMKQGKKVSKVIVR